MTQSNGQIPAIINYVTEHPGCYLSDIIRAPKSLNAQQQQHYQTSLKHKHFAEKGWSVGSGITPFHPKTGR